MLPCETAGLPLRPGAVVGDRPLPDTRLPGRPDAQLPSVLGARAQVFRKHVLGTVGVIWSRTQVG